MYVVECKAEQSQHEPPPDSGVLLVGSLDALFKATHVSPRGGEPRGEHPTFMKWVPGRPGSQGTQPPSIGQCLPQLANHSVAGTVNLPLVYNIVYLEVPARAPQDREGDQHREQDHQSGEIYPFQSDDHLYAISKSQTLL